MPKELKEILELAVNAPSGHNSQPWKFVVKGEKLFIWNIPDKDQILFNYKQRGSLVAHGALIENIYIAASKFGYEVGSIILPVKSEQDLIAELSFAPKKADYPYQDLSDSILKRKTNRKPFKIVTLKNEDRDAIGKFINSSTSLREHVVFTEDRGLIGNVAASFSIGDRLLFENTHIHSDLFRNVNWTLEEEEERREGLYVMTKELSLLNRIIFKNIISKWHILSRLEKIKFPVKAAEKRAKLYQQCSAMGMITADRDSETDFVESGRLVQRFWLMATSLGLSYQPVSIGLLYLGQWCEKENPKKLTENQVALVKDAYAKILESFNIKNQTPIFSFRVGYSTPPTFSSLKKKPNISYDTA